MLIFLRAHFIALLVAIPFFAFAQEAVNKDSKIQEFQKQIEELKNQDTKSTDTTIPQEIVAQKPKSGLFVGIAGIGEVGNFNNDRLTN